MSINSAAHTQKRRLLDLFCGEGLAAWGYWRSGRFSEVVGIDINPKMRSRYAFDFLCGDALALDYDFLMNFDFIHASPPCQGYSKLTPKPESHMKLIAATHLMLQAAGLQYCIENVPGSTRELRPNIVMNGFYFGLRLDRTRYFHLSTLEAPHTLISSGHPIYVTGGDFTPRNVMIEAFGLDMVNENRRTCLTRAGINQGIPPIYTQTIAEMSGLPKLLVG